MGSIPSQFNQFQFKIFELVFTDFLTYYFLPRVGTPRTYLEYLLQSSLYSKYDWQVWNISELKK